MIIGKKTRLRSLRKDDLLTINRWRNNLQNRIITQGYRGPVTMEVDSFWLENVLKNTDSRNIYFGIEKIQSNSFIGIIQLNEIDYISRVATCGILIGEKKERGQALGVDAVRGILYYAFFILNLRKVIIYIAAFNKQAFKVQEKVGKVYNEGCLKGHYFVNGRYIDLHIQSFFKDDFGFLENDYSI